jgi:methyltransferase (TIGR00027 family)
MSRSAFTSAAARAAHLVVDSPPVILADTLAAALLGDRAEDLIGYHRRHGDRPVLAGARAQTVVRGRFVEDLLARAGFRQYVLLGAGLDSFAYRSPLAGTVRVFEVDAAVTQAAKRRALAAAGIGAPSTVSYVAADLAVDPVRDRLCDHGFDPAEPALVAWLGVVMYLDAGAIDRTLAAVAGFAPGTTLVFDHMLPAGLRDADGDAYVTQVAPATAEWGEPWRTFLAPHEAAALLRRHRFASVAHTDQRDAVPPELWHRTDPLRPTRLSVLTTATVSGSRG